MPLLVGYDYSMILHTSALSGTLSQTVNSHVTFVFLIALLTFRSQSLFFVLFIFINVIDYLFGLY